MTFMVDGAVKQGSGHINKDGSFDYSSSPREGDYFSKMERNLKIPPPATAAAIASYGAASEASLGLDFNHRIEGLKTFSLVKSQQKASETVTPVHRPA